MRSCQNRFIVELITSLAIRSIYWAVRYYSFSDSVLNVDKSKQAAATQGGWGWGGWLSQATASVTSGLTSVIETMETSLGVPDPNEMAKKVKEEEDQLEQESEEGQEHLSSSDAKGEGILCTVLW